MISYNFRLEHETPAHVTVGVFAGRNPGSRGKCGTLTMEPDEWRELEAIVGAGAVACGAVVEFGRTEETSAGGRPTDAELEAARARLEPYLNGYPQPMIDTRRLRIANGTASEQDRREVDAEDQVVRDLRAAGALPR